ncbi:MAG: hypothetical protein LBQ02_01845 [Candidatus Nomurabacteria bacterium]|jgi:hypothetical protein|nr:hypothetical protein [Candidatus Nomurabacteria bacterium]
MLEIEFRRARKLAVLGFFGALLLLFALLFVPSAPLFAEDMPEEQQSAASLGVALSPVYLDTYTNFDMTLEAGSTYGGENGTPCGKRDGENGCAFTVINKGQKDFVANISVEPYSMTDENYEISSNQATSRTELAKWIKFERTKYILKSGEELSIPFSITVPEGVAGGGQYAIIYVYAEGQNAAGGMEVGSRLGLPVFARINGETRTKVNVEKTDIKGFLLKPPITATSLVNNTGNVDVVAEYKLEVKNLFGKMVYEYSRGGHIMPETPRKVELVWEDTPSIGIFKVKQEVILYLDDETQGATMEKTVVVIPIWFLILAPLLVAGFVIVVVARRKMSKQ